MQAKVGPLVQQVHNDTVERYDAAKDEWILEAVSDPEAMKRAFLSSCVVDIII